MELDETHRFVLDVLFAGLTNRNIGFDSSLIPHVSPEDFQIVLDRCEETGAGICGIEIFDLSRWEKDHQVDFLDVVIRPEEGLGWARRMVRHYVDQPNISVCATFYSPEEEKAHKDNPDWHKKYVDLEEALGGGVGVLNCSEPQGMIASCEMRDQGPHNDAPSDEIQLLK